MLALEKERALRYYQNLVADIKAEMERLATTAIEKLESRFLILSRVGSACDAIDTLSLDERRAVADGLDNAGRDMSVSFLLRRWMQTYCRLETEARYKWRQIK